MCAKSPVGAVDVAFAPAVPLVGSSVNAGEGGDIGDAGPGIGVDAGEVEAFKRAFDARATVQVALAQPKLETTRVYDLVKGLPGFDAVRPKDYDYVMDEVGRDLVPDVERISAKFHERRHARRSPFERAVMRLTGMDVKLEQYRKGERFVRTIAEAGGPAALRRLWEGPESLPRHGEIDDPALWIARVMPGATA